MIATFSTMAGNVVQVTAFKDGSIEIDLVTALRELAAHGMARFTNGEARQLVGLLEHAIARTPHGWREVQS